MKKTLLSLFFLYILFDAYSQSIGFIFENDSSFTRGYIDVIHKDPMRVGIKSELYYDFKYYTASDLQEFGFLDYNNIIIGKYDSREFELNGVKQREFLRVLADGDLRLYMLEGKKVFFLEDQTTTQNTSSDLIQLTEENYQSTIKSFSGNCQMSDESGYYIKFGKNSLTRFVEYLNRGKCYVRKPASFGLLVGYNFARAKIFPSSTANNILGSFDIDNNNLKIGMYFDVSISEQALNLIGQLSYDMYKFSHQGIRVISNKPGTGPDETLFILQTTKLDLSFITLELVPKYSFKFKNYSPYIMAGLASSFLIDQKKLLTKEINQAGTLSVFEDPDFLDLTNLHIGYTGGIGLQYFYKPYRYIALELKNSKIFNFTVARKILSINNNYISLKFNF